MNKSPLYTLMTFPRELGHLVAEYAAGWTIAPWVHDLKLLGECGLWCDPDCGAPGPITKCAYEEMINGLIKNPRAGDVLQISCWTESMLSDLSSNNSHWALDILERHQHMIDYAELSKNSNPRAIALLHKSPRKIAWAQFSTNSNPEAIQMLRAAKHKVSGIHLRLNNSEEAKGLMDELGIQAELWYISENSSSWAIKAFQKVPDVTRYHHAFAYIHHPWAIEQIEKVHPYSRDWRALSMNPAAIEMLKENSDMVCIEVYQNPAIFEPTVESGLVDVIMAAL